MRRLWQFVFAFTASVIVMSSHAQTDPLCVGVGEAAQWPPEQEAVQAAPRNHRILWENEAIRVLEVTVLPGERENLHYHRWPSILVIDGYPKYVNYDQNGQEIKLGVPRPEHPQLPLVARLAPQAAHAIPNLDSQPFHAICIEYKTLCPMK